MGAVVSLLFLVGGWSLNSNGNFLFSQFYIELDNIININF